MLAESDNENEVRNDNVSKDESDEDSPKYEPTSEIEDYGDTIANSSTEDEDHNNEERDY